MRTGKEAVFAASHPSSLIPHPFPEVGPKLCAPVFRRVCLSRSTGEGGSPAYYRSSAGDGVTLFLLELSEDTGGRAEELSAKGWEHAPSFDGGKGCDSEGPEENAKARERA